MYIIDWCFANDLPLSICKNCDGSGLDGFKDAVKVDNLPQCPDCGGFGSYYDEEVEWSKDYGI